MVLRERTKGTSLIRLSQLGKKLWEKEDFGGVIATLLVTKWVTMLVIALSIRRYLVMYMKNICVASFILFFKSILM